MASLTQGSSLDNHLNESSLTENEGINTHHTADLSEHDSLAKRFCQLDDEQTNEQSQQNFEQHQWNEEFIYSILPHLGSLDNKSKNNRQNYNFILDQEI